MSDADSSSLEPMPLCEICWLDSHTKWEPESMDEKGSILVALVGVELPKAFSTGAVEVCCMCGSITIAGIYDMLSPESVYFPTNVDDSDYKFDLEFKMNPNEE